MPLKALVNGKYVIAPLMSDEEWSSLKESVKRGQSSIIMKCCNNSGHLRISKLKTKHFVHDRNVDCNWEPESLEHLRIKSDIVQICANTGWTVDVEVEGDSWIADVLATDGKRKIAFEVQMSPQTYDETVNRTLKYENNDIECYWLFQKIPKHNASSSGKSNTNSLYYCKVAIDRDDSEIKSITVTLEEDKTIPLREFIEGILLNKIKYCNKMKGIYRTTCKKIIFFTNTCWKCHRDYQAYFLEGESKYEARLGIPDSIFESDCGLKYGTYWNDSDEEDENEVVSPFNPKIIQSVRDFLMTDEGKDIKIGEIKQRYSNTVKSSYISFGCPYCDAIFGNWYYQEAMIEYQVDGEKPLKVLEVNIDLENRRIEKPEKHWCYPKNGEFCER